SALKLYLYYVRDKTLMVCVFHSVGKVLTLHECLHKKYNLTLLKFLRRDMLYLLNFLLGCLLNVKLTCYPSFMSNNFCFLLICFNAYSLFNASDLLSNSSWYTSLTGRLIFVYFAPLPSLCTFNLRSKSVVYPVYNV